MEKISSDRQSRRNLDRKSKFKKKCVGIKTATCSTRIKCIQICIHCTSGGLYSNAVFDRGIYSTRFWFFGLIPMRLTWSRGTQKSITGHSVCWDKVFHSFSFNSQKITKQNRMNKLVIYDTSSLCDFISYKGEKL